MFTSEMFGSCVCSGGEKLPCNCLVRSHAEDMIPWTLITRTLNFYPVFLRQLIGFNASIVNFQNWTKCCAAAMLLSEKNEFVHICHLEKSVCLLLAKFPPEAGVAQSESRQSLRTGKILTVDRWTNQVDRWTLHTVPDMIFVTSSISSASVKYFWIFECWSSSDDPLGGAGNSLSSICFMIFVQLFKWC